MVDYSCKEYPLSVQAELLSLHRSGLYYKPVVPSEQDCQLRRLIDQIYMQHPEFGHRRIAACLNHWYQIPVDRRTVLRHMQDMGIQAIYPRQNTSKANPENKVYPYLLKNIEIDHPNHVWSIDITYIPLRKSWMYLVAILDWYSRYVVDWMLDDTLDIHFVLATCKRALKEAYPEIMNSDQGSHFTSPKYISLFLESGSRISMDHRGRAFDNIFIERLWRSLKYENIYQRDYGSPREAHRGITEYFQFYNTQRPHQSLDYLVPAQLYFNK